jgi:hypothetical protein
MYRDSFTLPHTVYRLEFPSKYVSDTRRMFPSHFGPLEQATLDPWTLHLTTVCETLRLKKLKTRRNIQNKSHNAVCDPHFATSFLSMIYPTVRSVEHNYKLLG